MAILLFNHYTPHLNLYIYNTMINALSFLMNQSFTLYNSMLHPSLLYLVIYSLQFHAPVRHMPVLDAVSFNIMIVGYAKRGYSLEALELFREMVGLGLEPDEFTIVGLLVSCEQLGNARLGKSVHAWIEQRKSISSSNLILGNALLDMYVGELDLAHTFFDHMPGRNLFSWNSLISGYSQKGDYMMVMSLCNNMALNNVRPDSVTMAILVHAAAEIGGLEQGKLIHSLVVRMQMKVDAFLGSALIDTSRKPKMEN
ncbi:pentatricopeptide repeat-containing protein At3g04750, mitochondrial [Fagus crenata]